MSKYAEALENVLRKARDYTTERRYQNVEACQRDLDQREEALLMAIAAVDRLPAAPPEGKATFDPVEVTRLIVLDVAEIPDRTSPDDQPEIMLVKDSELRRIVHDRLMEALLAQRQAASSPRGTLVFCDCADGTFHKMDNLCDECPRRNQPQKERQ